MQNTSCTWNLIKDAVLHSGKKIASYMCRGLVSTETQSVSIGYFEFDALIILRIHSFLIFLQTLGLCLQHFAANNTIPAGQVRTSALILFLLTRIVSLCHN